MAKTVSISFVAPAVLLDFLAFLYRLSFVDGKYDPSFVPPIWDWKRISEFEVATHLFHLRNLFKSLDELDEHYFHTRQGMLVFSVYVSLRNHPAIEDIVLKDRVSENDPVLEKRKLFEACMNDITDIQIH